MTGFQLAGLVVEQGSKASGRRRNAYPCHVWKPRKNGCACAQLSLPQSRVAALVPTSAVLVPTSAVELLGSDCSDRGLLSALMRELNALLVTVNAQGPVMRCGRTVRGERDLVISMPSSVTNAGAGFRGKTPDMGHRWTRSLGGHRKRAKIGSCCGHGHWRIRGAAASSTDVRDLACMWSFGPSAVEGSRLDRQGGGHPSPAKSNQRRQDLVALKRRRLFCSIPQKAKQLRNSAVLSCW
jgi:hypothetical protein